MPIVEMLTSAPPTTAAALDEAERQLGAKLPATYREFLLAHNGGQPSPDCFKFHGSDSGSMVNTFLGVNHPDKTLDVVRRYNNGKRFGEEFLPIAIDAGGSYVLLGIRGDRYGKVYFWSLEDEPDPPSHPATEDEYLWLVANSFAEFIAGMYDEDPDAGTVDEK